MFPLSNRDVIGSFDGWNRDPEALINVTYTGFNYDAAPVVYTDNLNRSYIDKGREVD